MKRLLSFLCMVMVFTGAYAQHYYQDAKNPQMLRHATRHEPVRVDIVLPLVNGYNIYTADLHTHTVYSDGRVTPSHRVQEAWLDGIDIIALTDHIEYRPVEKAFYNYLKEYTDEDYPKKREDALAKVDLNVSVKEAISEGEKYGMVVIPGIEITRDGTKVGHFNALFTVDNNRIYDEDPLKAIRNAKLQGALVMHNHPGWRKTSIDFTETEKQAYQEGLIDGVEVMNGSEFYPGIIDRSQEWRLFIAANTDIHGSTSDYRLHGHWRPMTLVFSKDKTLESVREALDSCRTIALGFDTLCGDSDLLKDFFAASVEVDQVEVGDNRFVILKNKTSIPFYVQNGNSNPYYLEPLSSVRKTVSKTAKKIKLTVLNMWDGADTHPVVEIKL